MDVANVRTAIMPSGEETPEPDVYEAIVQGHNVSKADALNHLKALEKRKNRRVAATKDPEEQRSARITAEACSSLVSSISARKDLESKPVDVDVELAALIDDGHAKQAALLDS